MHLTLIDDISAKIKERRVIVMSVSDYVDVIRSRLIIENAKRKKMSSWHKRQWEALK